MEPKRIAESLVRKFKTRDPFCIADEMGYIVIRTPLKGIRGFYQRMKRRQLIFIDSNLSEQEARFVCAHEIGHALMHRGLNRVFMDTGKRKYYSPHISHLLSVRGIGLMLC